MNFFETKLTDDGSLTFYSQEFGETFHSKYGAKSEAEITYIQGCNLLEKVKRQDKITILDVCYGLGYNTAAALDCIFKTNPKCEVEIIALELDETVPSEAISHNLLSFWSSNIIEILTQLLNLKKVNIPQGKLQLLIGDARQTIQPLVKENFQADAIFFDPFSPPKCPQLWSVEFISLVAKCLNPDGIIATYSCSAAVRTAFSLSGLTIGANYSVGRRSPGTLGTFSSQPLPPLSQRELEHLQTRACVPFRDPELKDTIEIIKQRRKEEQNLSNLEFTSKWKKRWFS
jgi:tRNA U34 5-methylaminomethyl-2-thiouridine-forming methyltransferase MnmC